MTVDQLIEEVLNSIRNHWYADRIREFKRDERALMRAILRYGYECDQRGWPFDVPFIFGELMTLLKKIRTTDADIKYLPVYLDGAVKRWIGGRAEELSARAKTIRVQTHRTVAALGRVEAIHEPTGVEVCAAVFKALRKRPHRPAAKAKQGDLL